MSRIRTLLAATLLGALYTGLIASTFGEEPSKKEGTNKAPREAVKAVRPGPAAQGVSDLALAHTLIGYGRAHKSPEGLLAAAEILIKTPANEAKEKPVTEKNAKAKTPPPGEKAAEAKARDNSPRALLAEAKRLSKDDPNVIALATRLERQIEEPRGAVFGPNVGFTILPGNCNSTYRISFRAGELATVAVVGSGTTDLDLFVYDENGKLVAQDIGLTDRCFVSWVPRWTGTFTIRVVNLGFLPNGYSIAHN